MICNMGWLTHGIFLGWLLGSLAASGLDSGFLAASGLDSVLVAASGLDSGLGSGFLAASRLDSGLLAACSCRGMALFLAHVSSERAILRFCIGFRTRMHSRFLGWILRFWRFMDWILGFVAASGLDSVRLAAC